MCVCVLGQPEPVGSVLMFPSGYDTLEYSWVKATAVSVRLQILFVMLQNTNTCTPSREPQRRLNNTMRDVVKKEVLKFLPAGIIYPVPHSEWVSPVQVVPKKGGMTIIQNSKNELIPQRPVTG